MAMRNIHRLIVVIAVLVSAAACRKASSHEIPPKPVQTQLAESHYAGGESGEGERYSANIVPASQNELAFKYGGYVTEVLQVAGPERRMRLVQDGDSVLKGTILARLRADDFNTKVRQAESQVTEAQSTLATNRAQLAEAEAAVRQAERDMDRATKLFENRALTRAEFDGAKAKLEMAQARAETVRAQSGVIQAKIGGAQAVVGEAKLAEQDSVLRAPTDCYVLKRLIEPGALVAPGRPLFIVADRSSVKAMFGVPDVTVRMVKMGTSLPLTTEAMPGVEFRGWISRISPAADPRSRVFDVEVSVPRPPEQLRPGMIASVTLPSLRSATPLTMVPINAIVRLKQSPESYAVNVVIGEAGKETAKQRAVKLGAAFGNKISIEEGVSAGDRVIVSGSALIVDGERVKVIP